MKYRCNGCGYEEDAEARPSVCPKCGDNDADERNSVNPAPAFSPVDKGKAAPREAPKSAAKTAPKRGK